MSRSLQRRLTLAGLAACLAFPGMATADEMLTAPVDEQAPASKTTPMPEVSPPAPAAVVKRLGDVEPGPLVEQRKALIGKILAAKKQGFGIAVYLAEFNKIEEKVKAGEPAENYQERLESIGSGLDDQLKRSQVLKTQRPVGAVSSPVSSDAPKLNAASATGGKDNMMDQLKNQIPGGLGNIKNLTPEQKEKLMQSDMAKELLKKFTGGQ